jgi:heptosyltransferase-3
MRLFPQRILLIATRQIGDVLLTTPLLHSLRQAYPDAIIDMLVFAGTEGVLAGNQDCSEIYIIPQHSSLKQQWNLIKKIFSRYDLAISTQSSDKALFYAYLAATRRVAVVPTWSYRSAWKYWITTARTVLDDENTHTVMQNLRLAELLQISLCYQVVNPYLVTDEAILTQLLPFDWKQQDYVVFHLVPLRQYKRWTMTGWQQLAYYFDKQGVRIILTGSGDAEEMHAIHTAMQGMPDNILNLAGKLSLSAVATLIRQAKLYVGVDTVVTHLAAATGTTTVALYGPTNPVKWAPFPCGYAKNTPPFQRVGTQRVGNVILIQGEGECVPCHQEGCDRHRDSSSQCLEKLSSQTVVNTINSMG